MIVNTLTSDEGILDGIGTAAAAVTALFVPADRPDRYAKAAAAGADIVIIDLEDAVASTAKKPALAALKAALAPEAGQPVRALVRVNGIGTDTHEAEVAALVELAQHPDSGLLGVVLPKVEDADQVAGLARQLRGTGAPIAVVALIESAIGVLNAATIARAAGVTRLALGAIDLTVDVDAEVDSPIVTQAMTQLVLASRAARIAAPLASPSTAINDADTVRVAAGQARRCGFSGMLCIHPSQIAPVRAALLPSNEQVAWARRVVDAGDGAVQIDGQMIDKPVIDKARLILRRVAQT